MGSMKFLLAVMVLVLLSVPSWLQAEEPQPVLKGVRVFRSADALGVEISADRDLEYTCSKMPQLLRIIIDLPRTDPGRPETVYRYKSALISSIRIEKKSINDVMITRVSVNLSEDADFTARTDPTDSGKVTIFLRKPAPDTGAATAAVLPEGSAAHGPSAAGKSAAPAPTAPKEMLPTVVARNHGPATVTAVTYFADSIEIRSEGSIGAFKAFPLQNPGRLVIDITNAQTALRAIAITPNRLGVSKARISPFEGKLRVVFETGGQSFPECDVVRTGTGLRVVLRPAAGGKP